MRAIRDSAAGGGGTVRTGRPASASALMVGAALAAAAVGAAGCGGAEPGADADGPPAATDAAADTDPVAGAPGPDSASVALHLIALEAGGERGTEIGCGDALVAVERAVAVEDTTTAARLRAALAALLATDGAELGPTGEAGDTVYNALRRSELRLDGLAIEGGRAEARLSGELRIGGACDAPRVEAQLRETVRAVTGAEEVVIQLDGETLEDALSARGR